jgi:hypothetical protein
VTLAAAVPVPAAAMPAEPVPAAQVLVEQARVERARVVVRAVALAAEPAAALVVQAAARSKKYVATKLKAATHCGGLFHATCDFFKTKEAAGQPA